MNFEPDWFEEIKKIVLNIPDAKLLENKTVKQFTSIDSNHHRKKCKILNQIH